MLQYFTESVAWLQRLLGPYLQQYWFNYTSFLTWLDVMAQRITEDLFSLQEQLFGPQTQQYSVFFLRSLNSYLRSLFSTTAIIYPLASNVWNITCGQTCQTHNVSMTIPDAGTGVRLQSYSYCGGALKVSSYIENIDYVKVVTLHYTNALDLSTPLSVIQLGYDSSIVGTNWELWTSNNSYINSDGITRLTSLTYRATDVTYTEQLNVTVVASDPTLTTSTIPVPYATPTGFSNDISTWLAPKAGSEAALAKSKLFTNIEVPDAAKGTVIAAQSYSHPDYAYHWVRDASLTMDVVQSIYAAAPGNMKLKYANLLFGYAAARAQEQTQSSLETGLGEPKFNLDNSIFTASWGRPQNDGPATAAIALMEFANAYIAAGGSVSEIRTRVYDSATHPDQAPVLKDLLFVARYWSAPSFDLWEEESADHFYTRIVQHRALVMGAALARLLGDSEIAEILSKEASAMARTLTQFWDPVRQILLYEYGPVVHGKYSYIDVAVILGVIHGYAGDGLYSFTDDQLLSSAVRISMGFNQVFGISSIHADNEGRALGPPIGRYPEDTYDGLTTSALGNPWYLATISMAEFMYRAALGFKKAGSITITATSEPFWSYFAPQVPTHSQIDNAKSVPFWWFIATPEQNDSVRLHLITYDSDSIEFSILIAALEGWGDAFLRTVKYYTPEDGRLAEEFNRDTGAPQGAADLTWSYASLLTAAFARAEAMGDAGYVEQLAALID